MTTLVMNPIVSLTIVIQILLLFPYQVFQSRVRHFYNNENDSFRTFSTEQIDAIQLARSGDIYYAFPGSLKKR